MSRDEFLLLISLTAIALLNLVAMTIWIAGLLYVAVRVRRFLSSFISKSDRSVLSSERRIVPGAPEGDNPHEGFDPGSRSTSSTT